MHYRGFWLLLGWLYVLLLLYGSLIRVLDINTYIDHTNKLIHFLLYFLLAGWFVQLYSRLSQRIVILGSEKLLGIIIEFLQGRKRNLNPIYLFRPAVVNLLLVDMQGQQLFDLFQGLRPGQFFKNMTQVAVGFHAVGLDRLDQAV